MRAHSKGGESEKHQCRHHQRCRSGDSLSQNGEPESLSRQSRLLARPQLAGHAFVREWRRLRQGWARCRTKTLYSWCFCYQLPDSH